MGCIIRHETQTLVYDVILDPRQPVTSAMSSLRKRPAVIALQLESPRLLSYKA